MNRKIKIHFCCFFSFLYLTIVYYLWTAPIKLFMILFLSLFRKNYGSLAITLYETNSLWGNLGGVEIIIRIIYKLGEYFTDTQWKLDEAASNPTWKQYKRFNKFLVKVLHKLLEKASKYICMWDLILKYQQIDLDSLWLMENSDSQNFVNNFRS